MNTKVRYEGVQDFLKWFDIGNNGCYLLSLCSIAEEVTGKPADLIGLMADARRKQIFDNEQNILDPCGILQYLTEGKRWKLRIEAVVPSIVKDEEYTVLKYKWKYAHFRRRGFDTLNDSQTVKNGQIIACYVFTLLG